MSEITIIRKLIKFSPEQLEEFDMVLTKVISQEPLTDEERVRDPEVWAFAERFFDFKTGKAPEQPTKDIPGA